jgi:hypothetical protein
MTNNLVCWKCGESISAIPQPIGRRDACPACHADLHVCRMCEFYDLRVSKACREPVADEVKDKERTNFCDYFRVKPEAYQVTSTSEAEAAKAQLEALFGGRPDESKQDDSQLSEADAAREKLEQLFKKD